MASAVFFSKGVLGPHWDSVCHLKINHERIFFPGIRFFSWFCRVALRRGGIFTVLLSPFVPSLSAKMGILSIFPLFLFTSLFCCFFFIGVLPHDPRRLVFFSLGDHPHLASFFFSVPFFPPGPSSRPPFFGMWFGREGGRTLFFSVQSWTRPFFDKKTSPFEEILSKEAPLIVGFFFPWTAL